MMDFPTVPNRMALINVDMQNYFVESPKRAGKGLLLLERINSFAAICRAAGILVIHTRGIVRADGADAGVFGEIFPPGKDMFNKDAPTAALHPDLIADSRDVVLERGVDHADRIWSTKTIMKIQARSYCDGTDLANIRQLLVVGAQAGVPAS